MTSSALSVQSTPFHNSTRSVAAMRTGYRNFVLYTGYTMSTTELFLTWLKHKAVCERNGITSYYRDYADFLDSYRGLFPGA